MFPSFGQQPCTPVALEASAPPSRARGSYYRNFQPSLTPFPPTDALAACMWLLCIPVHVGWLRTEKKHKGGLDHTLLPDLSWPRDHCARHCYSPTPPDSALCSRRVECLDGRVM